MEYVVEVSYSGGTFWSEYYIGDNLNSCRGICDMLTKTSQGNFKTRIIKKEIVE